MLLVRLRQLRLPLLKMFLFNQFQLILFLYQLQNQIKLQIFHFKIFNIKKIFSIFILITAISETDSLLYVSSSLNLKTIVNFIHSFYKCFYYINFTDFIFLNYTINSHNFLSQQLWANIMNCKLTRVQIYKIQMKLFSKFYRSKILDEHDNFHYKVLLVQIAHFLKFLLYKVRFLISHLLKKAQQIYYSYRFNREQFIIN
ncbi:unnamed protein product [Paramecium sonneborni]|uniref:Uncharacterized protein n=1 Tax=Paramecium sonneborni TaxID=65129 RepID=A0A8S1P137_9CILI|nr:unnamed protein product [Paramecium sonneborni]